MTYEVVVRLGDTQLDVAYVDRSYRIAGVELVRDGKIVGHFGLLEITVTRTTPLDRSVPYARGDDRKIIPYLGVALAAHLVLWGFATRTQPVRERVVPRRPEHVAKLADTLLDEITDDESPDSEQPGQGVPMGLAAGASGADAESAAGHITVANIDDSPRVAKSEALDETAGTLGAITADHIKTLTGSADLTSAFDDASTAGALHGEASGGTFGLARSGFGPGGGGNDWGTIGISYTSHWSNGTSPGRGWGGSDPGVETIPRRPIRIRGHVGIEICGRPYVNDCMLHGGDIDARYLERYVKPHFPEIASCWDKRWVADPNISNGPLRVDFTIGDDGKVTKISTGGIDAEVERCVAGVYQEIAFPRRGLQVRHILVYSKSTHN